MIKPLDVRARNALREQQERRLKMDQSTKNQIWEEIIQATKAETLDRMEGELTVREFIELVHGSSGRRIGRDYARRILDERVTSGELIKRKLYLKERGAVVCLYRPA
jgi:hypothetical protein